MDTCSNTGACANCWPGSQGPCQSGIGVCYAANAGTSICPAGTASCGSASPTPCVVDPWSEWGECTATCGGGTQLRTRGVSSPASHGGDACGDLFESRTCNTAACSVPVACEVSEWGAWDECSVDCGGGTQSRARSVVVPASGGGAACPLLTESRTCNDDACVGEPVDCVISEWGPWSECVAGSADQSRSRSVVTSASNGGSACPSELVQTRTSVCVVDCVASEWSDWGPCSLACGGGVQDRSRSVDVVAQNGGLACGALSESRSCNAFACPLGVDCELSAWSAWGACSSSCGGGTRVRQRNVETPRSGAGQSCPSLVEDEPCNIDTCAPGTAACTGCWFGTSGPCISSSTVCFAYFPNTLMCPGGTTECADASPVACVVDPWSEWGECTATCGGGTQLRTRGVSSPASHGGDACGDLFESRTCNTAACSVPVACEVSEWGAWDECSVDCGGGTQSRARSVVVPASGGGAACPLLTESRTCNDDACVGEPVDCVISEWGPWSECVAGSADQSRSRSVVTSASNGGSACPSELVQTRTSVCVVDCVASEWSDWGPCSLACGGGVQDRSRSVDVVAQNGGLACGALSESRGCNSEACAAECASCFPGSSGNCRSVFNVCYAAAGGVCPAGTVACTGLAGVLSVATTGTPQGAVRGRIEVHDTPGDFPHTTESWASSPLLHSFRVVVARLLSSPSRHEVTPAHVVAGLAEVSGDMAVVDIEVLSFAANDVLGRPATRSPADLALQLSSAVINGSLALDLKAAGVINASSVGTVAMAEALSVEAARGDENDIANSEGGPESDPADAPSNHTYLWLALGGAAIVAIAAVVVAVGRKRPTRVQTLPTVHAMPQRPRVASVPPLATVAGNTGSGRVVWG